MLFKYMPNCYVSEMLNKGTIRIGTLGDYSKIEKHGGVIGDDWEGSVSVKKQFTDYTAEKDDQLASKWGFKTGGRVRMIDCWGHKELRSHNCYIYCFSRRLSARLANEFNCDAAVEVKNITRFADKATEAMVDKGLIQGSYIIAPTCYVQNPGTDLDIPDIHPSLIKRVSYAYQEEIRIIWPVLQPKRVEPQIIDIGAIRDFSEVVDIRDDKRSRYAGTVYKNIYLKNMRLRLVNPALFAARFESCHIVIDSLLQFHAQRCEFDKCTFELSESILDAMGTIVNISKDNGMKQLFRQYLEQLAREIKLGLDS